MGRVSKGGRLAAVAAVAGVAIASMAILDATTAPAQAAGNPDMVALGVGVYDVLHDNKAAEFRGEYRFGWSMLPWANEYFTLSPQLGAMGTDHSTFYGYGGIRFEIPLGPHFQITPSGNVGYWRRGSGKDLGNAIEFKTGAELAYKFDNRQRLGLAFDHMSNAGIGTRNPGVESLMIFYSFPLGK